MVISMKILGKEKSSWRALHVNVDTPGVHKVTICPVLRYLGRYSVWIAGNIFNQRGGCGMSSIDKWRYGKWRTILVCQECHVGKVVWNNPLRAIFKKEPWKYCNHCGAVLGHMHWLTKETWDNYVKQAGAE
jgi:hypothetical protein